MPIRLTCPSCAAIVKAPESLAGKTASCPRCHERLKVPELAPELELDTSDHAFDEPVERPVTARPAKKRVPGRKEAEQSLFWGVLALLLCCPLGFVSITFGIIAASKSEDGIPGQAVAGIVLGVAAFFWWFFAYQFWFAGL